MPAEEKAIRASVSIRRSRQEDSAAISQILRDSPQAALWAPGSDGQLGPAAAHYSLVCESNGQVVGFLLGRQAAEEAEILNLAVSPINRHSGIASALLAEFHRALRANRIRRVFLEVRESNASAIAFYQTHGFAVIGRRRGYYQQPPEEALLMERVLRD